MGNNAAKIRAERVIPARAAEPVPDDELVRRALAHDTWAEQAIVDRYVGVLTGVALRMLRGHADAEDVVQDTFIAALEKLDSLREPARLRSWLLQIAVRKIHRIFRRRRLLRALHLDGHDDDNQRHEVASSAAGPEMIAELSLMYDVLETLPARARLNWMLRAVEGHALMEVAKLSGCSLATVKRDLVLVESQLRKHISFAEVTND